MTHRMRREDDNGVSTKSFARRWVGDRHLYTQEINGPCHNNMIAFVGQETPRARSGKSPSEYRWILGTEDVVKGQRRTNL